MKTIIELLINFYQKNISPFLGANCRYQPTCSEYCRQAIKSRGLFKGLLLSLWRILRCNPFSKGGWDPVDKNN
ncbi:MAG: membrane protein insertion efficiency factor YidD [bacterium]